MIVQLILPGDIIDPFDETPDWEDEEDDETEWFPHEGKLAA